MGANILSGGNFKKFFLVFGVAGSIYWCLFLVLNLFSWEKLNFVSNFSLIKSKF